MKITKGHLCILFLCITSILSAQEHLKGLTKATQEEISKKQIMLDGETIPVYNLDGKRIRGQEMMEAIMSGNYTPDFYLDDKKDIKVIALRLSTKEEKEQMKMMQQKMAGKSEMVGKKAADFTVTAIDGTTYTLSELKGKIVVLNFWFVECKPCVMEIPELNEVVEKYKDNKDVVFLGLATNKKPQLEKFIKKQAFEYAIVPETRDVAQSYNVTGYPTHIVINKMGEIAFETSGLSPVTVSNLENAIKNSL